MSFLPLLAALANPAAADTWVVDASHSDVGFKISHMTISSVRGSFEKFEGAVEWDGAKVDSVTVEATVDVASVDTRDEKRDEHLRGADFFDAAQHPTMTFVSTEVSGTPDALVITGDLTLHGVTKSVTLKGDGFKGAITDPWGNTKTGASVSGAINRHDFGMSWSKALDSGGLVVGDEVTIELEIELNKK